MLDQLAEQATPSASHTPWTPRPVRACSCALPDDYSSSSGWHLRPASDQGCFEMNRTTEQKDQHGNRLVGCMRGVGRHACTVTGEVCLYAGVEFAIEPCPHFIASVERAAAQAAANAPSTPRGGKHARS